MKIQIFVMPARIAGIQVCTDASGNIHVNLDSSTPCWNDAMRDPASFDEGPPSHIFKGVLIAQAHSPDDDLAFIKDIEPALRDQRYIRVNGRPVLIVYRPGLLPDPKASAQRWRDYCTKSDLDDLYLAAVQAFETIDPRSLGFDAAVEFPPHKLGQGAPVLNSQMEIVNSNYQGVIYDYNYFIESAKKIPRSTNIVGAR